MSLVGQHLGRYRILEQLGQGGMSVVYRGLDTSLAREVAIKVLHPHLSHRPESRLRMEREAQAVARLHHANILEVFDYSGAEAPQAFLVTEYIRGQTLRQFLSHETLQPPEIAAMVVHELAAALAHAHEAGILHRDLKPENVMVRDDGVLKLMDFGIAKILDREEKMTMTGALVGSPAHMAPEIIEGEAAGAEADVFSLGTMLYLFATGTFPFSAPNTTATLKRILDCRFEDPRQITPTVSDELAQIIGTCLKRNPQERFHTAIELKEALGDALKAVGIDRPHEQLTEFFLNPGPYRQQLSSRLVQTLLAQATQALLHRRGAKALSALNRVLALEPSNQQAEALLRQMQSRARRTARLKALLRWSLTTGLVALGLAATGVAVRHALKPTPFAPHFSLEPTDVRFSQVHWPQPQPASEPQPEATPETIPAVPTKAARKEDRTVEVALMVRPFGYVQVDEGPRSSDALARHSLRLSPGRHRVTVSCDLCEAGGQTTVVDVHQGDEIPLRAPLKPSSVIFRGWSDVATVRIGTTEKSVADAQVTPFRINSPPAGNAEMRHRVEYWVQLDGQTIDRGVRYVIPGETLIIERGQP